jgi:outer membrane protein OmpA-like peptidoglycan-associated protein
MKTRLIPGILLSAYAAGCVAERPKELMDAHATYERVAAGPTATVNPSGLADAKVALDRADKSYEDHKYMQNRDMDFTRDEAYVATRKTQLAEAEANLMLASQEKAKLDRELQAARLRQRPAPTSKTDDAAQKLANVASVKQDERGTILTLAGNIVFASGQYKLRADSYPKLTLVATTVKDLGGKTVIVEGYTDSTGSDAANMKLSMKRASAVRDYLIRQGLPADQIKAKGYGKERPIASNATPEGRAQNRRVEIVIQPATT